MASLLKGPSTAHFNSLPCIEDSNVAVKQRCNAEVLAGFCDILRKHDLHKKFGFGLVHQHFDLSEDERLVNFQNIAVPVKVKNITANIAATRWAFDSEQKLVPYEFTQGAPQIEVELHRDFLEELGGYLEHHGLSKYLGLGMVNSAEHFTEPTMEFTSGRANVTVPFDIDPDNGLSIEAFWQVSEGPVSGAKVFAQCKARCKSGPNTGHTKHHLKTRS